MPEVRWLPEALDDLDRLFEFLNGRNPEAARRAALEIAAAADRLLDYPRMGKLMADDSGRRELPAAFGKRGYILRYMLDEQDVPVIIRVWHSLENRNDP